MDTTEENQGGHFAKYGLIYLVLALVVGVAVLLEFLRPPLCGIRQSDPYVADRDLHTLASALDEYAIRHDGRYPDDIDALVQPDDHGHRYLNSSRIPYDPWGTAYIYIPPPKPSGTFVLMSYGADASPGGVGDDADRFCERD